MAQQRRHTSDPYGIRVTVNTSSPEFLRFTFTFQYFQFAVDEFEWYPPVTSTNQQMWPVCKIERKEPVRVFLPTSKE